MPKTAKYKTYGQVTFFEKVGAMASTMLHLPLVLGWTFSTSLFHETNRHKTWSRIASEASTYHVTHWLNASQMQWLTPKSTRECYEGCTKEHKLPVLIDELGSDARLLWLGERRTDKVILYLHGGFLLLPLQPFMFNFCKYVQDQLKNKDRDVGLVMLNYSLVPAATFPTQLTQVVLAVQHLLSTGLAPHNIQLMGDSAGGNLILQLISHILHPVADVPTLSLASPFGNALLISPWVCLSPKVEGSVVTNSKKDLMGIPAALHFPGFVRENTPGSGHLFLDQVNAPEGWFDDIAKVASKVLITAGDDESMRDTITVVAKRICEVHPEATYIVQENGIHDDPAIDFVVPTPKMIGSLTPKIVDWLASG